MNAYELSWWEHRADGGNEMRDNGGELEYIEGVGTVWTPDKGRLIGCATPGCPHTFFYVPERVFPGLCLACADDID